MILFPDKAPKLLTATGYDFVFIVPSPICPSLLLEIILYFLF
jgi:hypothetical protein